MVYTESRSGSESKAGEEVDPVKYFENLLLQRRKSNSPTIEDDFTVDVDDDVTDEEPFDEPRISPRKKMSKEEEPFDEPRARPKVNRTMKGHNHNIDAEIDNLTWTGSDLDVGHEKKENDPGPEEMDDNKSKSIHSLFWSESELEDSASEKTNTKVTHRNDVLDQRDDEPVQNRNNTEFRTGVADGPSNDVIVDDSMHTFVLMQNNSPKARENKSHGVTNRKESPKKKLQFDKSNLEKKHVNAEGNKLPRHEKRREVTTINTYQDARTRAERSLDEDDFNISQVDGKNSFARSPSSMTPSVAASVTKRTRNSKANKSKSPRSPFSQKRDDEDTAFGSVATASIEAGMTTAMNITCSILGTTPKVKNNKASDTHQSTDNTEDADLLDRFFENVESRACKTPVHKMEGTTEKSAENEEDGLKRLMNPFLDRLKQYDSVFEQLEEVACSKDVKNSDGSVEEKNSTTPIAFASEKFAQLLNKLEKFDPGFVTSEEKCDDSNETDSYNEDDNTTLSIDPTRKTFSSASPDNSPHNVLEKAWQNAETMVKEQKRTSFDKKDQLQKMKEQWFAARLNWKLRQQILAEAVKQKTAKAAKTTTEYVETMVSSCVVSMSTAKDDVYDKKMEEPLNRQSKSSIQGNKIEYESESDAYHDASSIDDSDFFSMCSPSQNSSTNSTRMGFHQSNILSPSGKSNMHHNTRDLRSSTPKTAGEEDASNFSYYSDNVLRTPQSYSSSSRTHSNFMDVSSVEPNVEKDTDKVNIPSTIGATTGALAVISEEVTVAESGISDDTMKKKLKKPPRDVRRWAYPAPSYYNGKSSGSHSDCDVPANPKEWFDKCKDTFETVYTASERFLDRAQCASASLNFADVNSFEDDLEDDIEDRESRNQSAGTYTPERIQKENSIVEDEDYSVSAIAAEPVKNSGSGDIYLDDDLSGFETAINDTDYEQDERPPMMRLMKSRDSRSCASSRDGIDTRSKSTKSVSRHSGGLTSISRHSSSKGGSFHSHLSTELPKDYTLADAIRHASISTQTSEANRTRVSQEPRGNKIRRDPSAHVRKLTSKQPPPPPPVPPKPPKLDADADAKPTDQPRIRSPKSSETNETSDMTATGSSFDVLVTKLTDSVRSKRSIFDSNQPKRPTVDSNQPMRPMVISVKTPTMENTIKTDGKSTAGSNGTSTSFKEECAFSSQTEARVDDDDDDDDDDDKGTVYTYNTNSTGSTLFKDCYQDAIPSLPTEDTLLEEEKAAAWKKRDRGEKDAAAVAAFLPSDDKIVRSVALLSVSAAVLNADGKAGGIPKDSNEDDDEVESVPPPASGYHHHPEETEAKGGTAANDDDHHPVSFTTPVSKAATETASSATEEPWDGGESRPSKAPAAKGKDDDETASKNPMIDRDDEASAADDHRGSEGSGESPAEAEEDDDDSSPQPRSEPKRKQLRTMLPPAEEEEEALSSSSPAPPHSESRKERGAVPDPTAITPLTLTTTTKESPHLHRQQPPPLAAFEEEGKDEEEYRVPQTTATPTTTTITTTTTTVTSSSATKQVSSTLWEPRSVEERRRRRLRQRRKFEKVLLGVEDDESSSLSSSTLSGGGGGGKGPAAAAAGGSEDDDDDPPPPCEQPFDENVPLISASFDTGFDPVPPAPATATLGR